MSDRLEELRDRLLAAQTERFTILDDEPSPAMPLSWHMTIAAGRLGWLSDPEDPHIPLAVPGG